jgi:signal transduction histidine kinase
LPEATPRRGRSDVGRLVAILFLVLVIGPLLIAAYSALQVARLPFPGLLAEPSYIVNDSGNPAWTGYAAGLRFPDQIVALDGQPLSRPTSLFAAMVDHQVGDVVRLTARDPYGGGELTVAVRLMAAPGEVLLNFFLLPYLVGVLYLAIGFWVVLTRRKGGVGVVFALLCAFVALVLGLFFDLYTTHRLWWVWVAALPLAGSTLMHLALIFPERLRLLARFPWLAWLVYLPGLALAALGVVTTADLTHPLGYFGPWFWGRAWGGLGVLLFSLLLLYHRGLAGSPVTRAQARTVLLGAILAFGPYVLWTLASRQVGLPFSPLLVMPWMVLFPLSIAYAILQQRTLDIGWVLRQSAVYGLLVLLLVTGYALFSLLVDRLALVGIGRLVALLLFAFGVVVALPPAQSLLQSLLNRLLGQAQVSREQALSAFGRAATAITTRGGVLAALGRALSSTISPQMAALYLLDESTGQFVPHTVLGEPLTVRFRPDGPLARRMIETRQALYVAPGSPLPADLAEEEERIAASGGVLFVPVAGQGWLAVGSPPLGRRFHANDLQFLESLAVQTAAAFEHVRLVSDLEWRTRELESVLRIAQALGSSLELDDLLELIYTQTGRILDVSNFYIALRDPERQVLRFAFYVENGERRYPDLEWPESEGLSGVVVRTRWPLVTDDYLAECERRGVKAGGRPGKAWMGVPLIARDEVLGVVTVSSFDPLVTFSEEQVQILRAIADQAATILDKTRLYQETEKRARQLEALNEVSSVITSSLDLNRVPRLVLEKAMEITSAEAGSLLLVDPEKEDLFFEVALGPATEGLAGVRLPMGTGIVGRVAAEATPLIVNDVTQDGRWFSGVDKKTEFVTRSILCVPLIARNQVIGVIELLNRQDGRPFNLDDQNLLTAFAAQAAVSIENARLFTTTDQALAARVDELSMMQRIDRQLNATLDYRQVMETTLDWALRVTGADIGLIAALFESEEGQQGLRFLAHRGYPEELISTYSEVLWPMDRGVVGRALRLGEPLLVEDVQSDPDYVPIVPGMVSQATVPIRREEQIVGVIVVESSRGGLLNQQALDFLVRLSDHAAIAIENARLFEAVQAANNAKTEFVSFVSHELKQPMTAIKGYSDLLFKGTAGELNDLQRSFMEVIRSNITRMDRLVQDLLDISRIESGRLRLDIHPVSVQEAVVEAVRGVQEQIAAKSQALHVEVADDLPPVAADRYRLVQVLVNLLSNAYKYTPQGGEIRLRVERADGPRSPFLRCSVTDTGIGISEEDQQRLFTKFFRAQDAVVRSEPGTGLGLVITKNLVEMQGGQIWVESEPGKGSTFTFTVPVANV